MKIDTSLIPKRDYKYKLVYKDGTTEDIEKVILKVDSTTGQEMYKFAQQFKGKNGLKKLWRFVRYKIKYQVDDFGTQDVKTPAALWDIGYGDCKSKTVFVNSVLYCLEIDHEFRFVRYDIDGMSMKHVYTVAFVDGQELPIDTVYQYFGKEKKFSIKKDFKPMTKIAIISGNKETGLRASSVTDLQKVSRDVIHLSSSKAIEKLKEIKQKQQYIPQAENISFNKDTEGIAALKIAKRQLQILKWMNPESAKVCQQGIELLDRVTTTKDFSICGRIPVELNGLCEQIKTASRFGMPANSHGLLTREINQNYIERKGCKIGAFPHQSCLNELWFADPFLNYNYTANNLGVGPGGSCTVPISNFNFSPYDKQLFLFYGRNSPYRVDLKNGISSFLATLNSLSLGSNPLITNLNNDASGFFQNQIDYDLTLKTIAQNSSVLSSYINDIYKDNPSGSLGSGLFYSFLGDVTQNGQIVNPNLFPTSVIAKGLLQGGFLDGSQAYSGVSRTNLKGMARNNILYDGGGVQPENTLSDLLRLHHANVSGSIGEPVTAVIAAIVGIVVAIVGAVAAAVATTIKAEAEARAIDNVATDTSRLSSLGPSAMPSQNDFYPLPSLNGQKENGNGFNLPLVGGAVALAVYALMAEEN